MACWDVILRKIHFFMKIGFIMAPIKIFSQHLSCQRLVPGDTAVIKVKKIFAKYRKKYNFKSISKTAGLGKMDG